jgi:hypothetical protein
VHICLLQECGEYALYPYMYLFNCYDIYYKYEMYGEHEIRFPGANPSNTRRYKNRKRFILILMAMTTYMAKGIIVLLHPWKSRLCYNVILMNSSTSLSAQQNLLSYHLIITGCLCWTSPEEPVSVVPEYIGVMGPECFIIRCIFHPVL